MVVHELKILIKFAWDIAVNGKNFEVRKKDRDYKVGDSLELKTPDKNIIITAVISYILNDKEYCKNGYVILGLKDIKTVENKYCYVDDNGNAWTEDEYTVEEAKEFSETLTNCYGCIDCRDCKDCKNCIECEECNNCNGEECNNCNDCRDCYGCDNCEDCTGCINCTNCKNCIVCQSCKDCTDCKYCEYCKTCRYSTNCYDEEDASYFHYIYCKKCQGCYYCSDCSNRDDCKGSKPCVFCGYGDNMCNL